MLLYHTSTVSIPMPDLLHSRPRLDFGRGFYLTPLQSQAERYGERFLRQGETAVLNVYLLDDVRPGCSCKIFNSYDGEWLDFVASCRKGSPHDQYDIIEGGVADDQVFDTVDLYFAGIYTREQALDQLRFKKPNYQICITSQKVIDTYLHFQTSKPLHL